MKKIITLTLCFIFIISSISALANASVLSNEKQRVIVGFKDQVDTNIIQRNGGDLIHVFTDVLAVATMLPEKAIYGLKNNPNIAYVELDARVWATGEDYEEIWWGVDRIDDGDGLVQTHVYNQGEGVNVAIIDTGIYYGHPDLDANYLGGYDFVNNDDDPKDDNGHGTHVAGIIAAESGNELGVVGVAPLANLYSLKVLDSSGSGYTSDIIAAINWARNNGIQIISMSLGSDYDDTTLRQTCDLAYSEGILLVAAAGNDYSKRGRTELNTVDYPARYDSVIAVGATTENDQKASYSSTGPAVELAAPGDLILSTFLPTVPVQGVTGYNYVIASGTSMACPHVSGAAALIWSGEPTLTVSEVRGRLKNTADDLGSSGFDYWFGHGIIDIDEAAPNLGPITNQPPVANAGPDQTVMANEIGPVSVTLDGSNSYDPEGKPISYQWNEGENLLSSESTFTEKFYDGSYTLTLTVTDDQGLTDTDTVTIKVNSYVQSIPMTVEINDLTFTSLAGGRVKATATITVTDSYGNGIAGVQVSGKWSGATSDSDSGLTNSNGQITFSSDTIKVKTSVTFTFTINEAIKDGYYIDTTSSKLELSKSYP